MLGRRFWILQRGFAQRYTIVMHNEDTTPAPIRSPVRRRAEDEPSVSPKTGQASSGHKIDVFHARAAELEGMSCPGRRGALRLGHVW